MEVGDGSYSTSNRLFLNEVSMLELSKAGVPGNRKGS